MAYETPGYPPEAPVSAAPARPPGSDDLEHLRLLSIFHYVLAGLVAVMSLLPFLQLAILAVALADPEVQAEPAARMVLTMLFGMMSAVIVAGLAFAVCLGLAGRHLASRTRYTFCLVMAALSCLLVPLGTLLGVFTIVVLLRPTVKERFGYAPAPT